MKKFFYRYRRYLLFLLQYFLLEKPRGLDFTMRDKSLMEDTNGKFSGYGKTTEKHVRQIFNRLPISDLNGEGGQLLDVGCGKGVVLKEAVKYPFNKIAGIEIQEQLVEIARNNFKILHIDDKVNCIVQNAIDFDGYGEYSIFLFSNPFNKEIFSQVIEKIIAENKGLNKKIYLIYYNPVVCKNVIEETGIFELDFTLFDSLRQYDTYVYSAVI